MVELAGQVREPTESINDGRKLPALSDMPTPDSDFRRLIDIQSSTERPADTFVAVKYRNRR